MASGKDPHPDPPSSRGILARFERLSGGSRESRQRSLRLLGQSLPITAETPEDTTQTFELSEGATPTEEERTHYSLQPEQLGSYRIIRRIGLGGMGTVYEAEQPTPRRRVALKTIHPWLLSETMRQRFELESQVLATLLHPNIPQIYEAGEIGERLFFAMEYIEGVSLSAFLEQTRPPTALRLELMASICEAVHHAHLRGIIHCDLKPANVLITREGEPKVLDFGIARTLDATPHRTDEKIFGTQRYMSPEQRAGRRLDVRADVYSLGVMLGECLPDAAPASLHAIVGKATADETAERYRSAEGLAADLRAFLSHHPLSVHPHTTGYLAAKFARRNPLLIIALATIMLAISAGSLTSLAMYRQARAAWSAEQEQRRIAEQARDEAASEAKSASETVELLTSTLIQATPEKNHGEEVTIDDLLVRIEELLEEEPYRDSPELRITIRSILTEIALAKDEQERALEHLEHAEQLYNTSSLTDSDTIARLFSIKGRIHRDRWEMEEARAALRQSLEIGYRVEDSPSYTLYQGHQRYARTLMKLGEMDAAREQFYAAITQSGMIQTHHPRYTAHSILALMEGTLGNHQQARTLIETAMAICVQQFAEEDPNCVNVHYHVGTLSRFAGELDEALKIYRRILGIYLSVYGDEHRRTLAARRRIAEVELLRGRRDQAEEQLQIAARNADADADTAPFDFLRATLHLARGDLLKARAFIEATMRSPSQQSRWARGRNQVLAGAIQWEQGDRTGGAALMSAGLASLCEVLGPDSPITHEAAPYLTARGLPGSCS